MARALPSSHLKVPGDAHGSWGSQVPCGQLWLKEMGDGMKLADKFFSFSPLEMSS